MYRKQLIGALGLVALFAILSLQAAAAVSLTYFTAEAQDDNTILLEWKTETELDTSAFQVLRSETASPANWGQPIDTEPAKGDTVTGATYVYTDTAITVSVQYYYLLRELTNMGGINDVATASAGIGVVTSTPSPRPTWTQQIFLTATPTSIAPTATRRFTDGPPTAAPGTATPRPGTTAAPVRAPTRTPLPAARVATPTGPALRVTVPVAVAPTVAATSFVSPVQRTTSTPDLYALSKGTQVETATPLPTKDVTPAIFASESEATRSTTSEGDVQTAGQGSRSTSLAFVIGGGAMGLAAVLVVVLLFLRSRRS